MNLQEAVTHYSKVAGGKETTLLELGIETGRTHQIRRHLAAIGHPVVGDAKYGDFAFNRRARASLGLRRMFLHSSRLALEHPITRKRLAFSAPLPDELNKQWGFPDQSELRGTWPIREEVIPLGNIKVRCRVPGVTRATLQKNRKPTTTPSHAYMS